MSQQIKELELLINLSSKEDAEKLKEELKKLINYV